MTIDMCCLGLSVVHTKFHRMWVVGLWIVKHDTMLRHAWVFGVDRCRDLFLRTRFVRTEPLKNFEARERDCSAALLPSAVIVPCPPECTPCPPMANKHFETPCLSMSCGRNIHLTRGFAMNLNWICFF